MEPKVVLTPLFGVPSDDAALASSLVVARKFDAHIDVLHVRADPRTMIPYIGEGMSGALVEEMIASAEAQADERATGVRAAFEAWREKSGLPAGEAAGGGPGCSWVEMTGRPDLATAHRARVADLVVMQRPQENAGETIVTETLESALLESGTPLLVVPERAPEEFGRHIAIAWNGGLEAARAVAAALPFLRAGEAVTAITVGNPAPTEAGADGLQAYLARHGIAVQLRAAEAEGGSVGATLLEIARDLGADLIVMGAYTHSRLRELVFGGVTREVLGAADLAVIMAH